MRSTAAHTVWVLMPPEFDYSGGLFLPCLARARRAARVFAAVQAARARGCAVAFDPGTHGLPAAHTAAALREEGATQALVAAGPHDASSARILCESLRRAGIAVGEPLAGDAAALIDRLRTALEGHGPTGAPLGTPSGDRSETPAFPPADASPPFCLLDPDAPAAAPSSRAGAPREDTDHPPVVLFREEDDRLLRMTPGAVPAIPEECGEIRLVPLHPGARLPLPFPRGERPPPSSGAPGTLYAACLPPPDTSAADRIEEWLAVCDRIIGECGRARFRLAGRGPGGRSTGPGVRGGAPWRDRYGLADDAVRTFLWRLTARHFPGRIGFLHALIGFSEMGIDPLEEMYAGNALPDRNAELLENIVP